jgi:hypothetical protein
MKNEHSTPARYISIIRTINPTLLLGTEAGKFVKVSKNCISILKEK